MAFYRRWAACWTPHQNVCTNAKVEYASQLFKVNCKSNARDKDVDENK